MQRRPLLLAGVGILAALVLRFASCDQAAADRWETDVKVVLKLHKKVVAANAERDRWVDSVQTLERIHLARADSLGAAQVVTEGQLAAAPTAADTMRLIQRGWAQCRLQVSELQGAHALCAERADTTKVSQEAAEEDAAGQAEVLADRPRPPRSLLFGVAADFLVSKTCGLGVGGITLEGTKKLWIFQARGRLTGGWMLGACEGKPLSEPGLTGGVTFGF